MIWFNFHTVKTTTTNREKKLGKKSLKKKKREENSFVLGTQVKYYDRAWCLNFMVINYLTQHHHRHHHQCTKERKKYTKQNKYLSKKTEWESIWYLFDWLHSIFDVFPPLFAIFLSKIDYIGNKRGDYYSINQNDCFIWKLFQFILLMDV